MSAALNNVTAPDAYSPAATLVCANTARVRMLVNNQAIYWRRGVQRPGGGGIEFGNPEEFLLPGVYSLDEVCDVIAVRAALKAAELLTGEKQAQVTITTRTREELGPL